MNNKIYKLSTLAQIPNPENYGWDEYGLPSTPHQETIIDRFLKIDDYLLIVTLIVAIIVYFIFKKNTVKSNNKIKYILYGLILLNIILFIIVFVLPPVFGIGMYSIYVK